MLFFRHKLPPLPAPHTERSRDAWSNVTWEWMGQMRRMYIQNRQRQLDRIRSFRSSSSSLPSQNVMRPATSDYRRSLYSIYVSFCDKPAVGVITSLLLLLVERPLLSHPKWSIPFLQDSNDSLNTCLVKKCSKKCCLLFAVWWGERWINVLQSYTRVYNWPLTYLSFRWNNFRFIYTYGLYCEGAYPPGGNHRYRRVTPQFYRQNPAIIHRLIPWLNRELVAILPHRDNVQFVLDHIIAEVSVTNDY